MSKQSRKKRKYQLRPLQQFPSVKNDLKLAVQPAMQTFRVFLHCIDADGVHTHTHVDYTARRAIEASVNARRQMLELHTLDNSNSITPIIQCIVKKTKLLRSIESTNAENNGETS